MALRLRPSRGLGRQIRRIVRREFGHAFNVLSAESGDAEATHDARQSLRKIRSVLRLIRAPLGRHFRPEDRRLRDIGRRLVPVRNGTVAAAPWRRLRARYPRRLHGRTTEAVAEALEARAAYVSERAGVDLARALVELRCSQTSTVSRLTRVGGFDALRSGMESGYRRARQAMRGLCLTSSAARFHRWRRRVKEHAYQVRLFEGMSRAPRARSRRLGRLETQLGDGLAMLRALVNAIDRDTGTRVGKPPSCARSPRSNDNCEPSP
jgi:CHAD domain-containing protein